MHFVKKGSALLLVIFVVSFFSVVVFAAWYKASMLLSLALQREKYYKNFYLTEMVLNYALKQSRKNFDAFFSTQNVEQMPIRQDFSFLLSKVNEDVEKVGASVIISLPFAPIRLPIILSLSKDQGERCENKLKLTAILQNEKTKTDLFILSCYLEKISEEQFVVQHFTIGNFI